MIKTWQSRFIRFHFMIFQGLCASLRTGNAYATASYLRFSRFAGHTCEAYYRLAGVSRDRKFLDSTKETHTAVLKRTFSSRSRRRYISLMTRLYVSIRLLRITWTGCRPFRRQQLKKRFDIRRRNLEFICINSYHKNDS